MMETEKRKTRRMEVASTQNLEDQVRRGRKAGEETAGGYKLISLKGTLELEAGERRKKWQKKEEMLLRRLSAEAIGKRQGVGTPNLKCADTKRAG